MRNKKIWITAAFISVIFGTVVLTAGRMMGGHAGFYIDGRGLHSAGDPNITEPSKGSKELDPFNSIELTVDYADVELVASDRFAIEYCIAGEYGSPVCEVRNNRLIFREPESFKMFHLGFSTGNLGLSVSEPRYYVRVEIPKNTNFSDVSLELDSGELEISVLKADRLDIKSEYGNVRLDKYIGTDLNIRMDSGNLSVDTLKADRTEIQNEYGEVTLSDVSGGKLNVKLDSGNCQIGRSDLSDVTITNEFGDVQLGVTGNISSYGFDLYTEYGDIFIDNKSQGTFTDDDGDIRYKAAGDGKKKISVSCDSGNIGIDSVKSKTPL